MNANSLARISLKTVLCIKGKHCQSFKEDACQQCSSISEITVVAGDATARIVQHPLWPEGTVLQHHAVLKKAAGPVWTPETGWVWPLQAPPSCFEVASSSLAAGLRWWH